MRGYREIRVSGTKDKEGKGRVLYVLLNSCKCSVALLHCCVLAMLPCCMQIVERVIDKHEYSLSSRVPYPTNEK